MSLGDLLCEKGVLYVNESLGRGGELINVYKIRTMIKDADSGLEKEVLESGYDQYGHPNNDPRITWWGKILRKCYIDELPQLYNLIKGDIKLVGIRAKRETDWKSYPQELKEEALKDKPGFVGVQYSYRGEGDFETHIMILQQYLEKRKQNPIRTDFNYFWRVVVNIIFRNVRSS